MGTTRNQTTVVVVVVVVFHLYISFLVDLRV